MNEQDKKRIKDMATARMLRGWTQHSVLVKALQENPSISAIAIQFLIVGGGR